MIPRRPQPYNWPRRTGVLRAWQLRDYATWLLPQLGRRWEAKGVTDFSLPADDRNKAAEPYQFQQRTGVLKMRQLRHFADYVFRAIGREAERRPFQWDRMTGVAFMRDLLPLAAHIQILLDLKRKTAP